MKTMLLATVLTLSASQAIAGTYVYISLGDEEKIGVYKMDSQSGQLTPYDEIATGSAPGAQAVDPSRRTLFAAVRSNNAIASFRIDPRSGKLSLVRSVPVGANSAYVATDRTGRYLLSAYYGEGKVAVHSINKDGSIDADSGRWTTTAEKAHCILTDRSNRFAFVPHTGPNAVFQFLFDERSGTLSANSVSKLSTNPETGPRHISFHPTRNYAYFDNEQGSSVTACTLDESSGTLRPFQTLSTLPADFTGKNTCADIEVSPSGKFLYSSNRGHDSIACYSIDAATGKLTSLGQAPTEETPRSFNVDPSGRFLFAAGQKSGKLAAYRIDQTTGKLERFATYTVGRGPAWVQVVTFSDN